MSDQLSKRADSGSGIPFWIKRGGITLLLIGAVAAIIPLLSGAFVPPPRKAALTHTVARGDLQVTITENGTLESSNNEEIKCLVKGGSTVLWVIETGTMVEVGDELVRLDTSRIEDTITTQEIAYETALANKIIGESDVAVAKKSITEYLEGTFLEEKSLIEKEIFDARQAVRTAELKLRSTERLAGKGLINSLQIQGEKFALDSAGKQLELKQNELKTLEKYKKEKQVQQLNSTLQAAEARYDAEAARLKLEESRLKRERKQLENCVIKATSAGMVIFPSAAEWKETPDIEEGATVREQQTLLMIPDLNQMQVKVGIHESKVGRMKVGMEAKIELQDITLTGKVDSIASITKPAGWWTGNMVKYDTIIKIEPQDGLKPGMSSVVDISLAEYTNVLTVPVAAVLEAGKDYLCWVETGKDYQRRVVEIGDTDDEFVIVKAGLAEGDKVVLNPLAFVDEAQAVAIQPAGGDDGVKEKSSEKSSDATDKARDKKKPQDKKKTASGKPKKKA